VPRRYLQGGRRDSRRFRTSDTTGTRCIVTGGHRERAFVCECSETRSSRSNEKIIYLPGYVRFQSARSVSRARARMHLKLRVPCATRCARALSLHRRCIHHGHIRADPCRRAIKSRAKSPRDIEFLSSARTHSYTMRPDAIYPISLERNPRRTPSRSLISRNAQSNAGAQREKLMEFLRDTPRCPAQFSQFSASG
jgi:hypothetical protein